MEEDLKLKSFANGVFSAVFREYNSQFKLPVRLPQSFGSGSCSAAESRSVLRQGSALRAAFTGAFGRSFARLRRSPLHYYSYLTSRCLRVCPSEGDPFRALVTVCALIAELNLFCCQNGCFAFLSTAPRSLVAIFDRKLRGDFYAGGGWDALGFFCEDFVKTEGELKSLDDILLRLEENSSSESDASEEEDSDEEDEDNPAAAENMSPDEEDSEKEAKGDSSESSDSDDSEEEVAMDGVADSEDSDDDSDSSSDDSDPSSMTEEDSSAESDDSSEEAPCEKPQVNGVATVPQLENQHIKPSDQKDSVT